jgi:hypothetical protein
MASTVVGSIEKRLDTLVSVDGDVVSIEQDNPTRDYIDYMEVKYADLDALIELLAKAKRSIETATQPKDAVAGDGYNRLHVGVRYRTDMATTFNVTITKTAGYIYAKAFGVDGSGLIAAGAMNSLMESLATKLKSLETAARYNALSDAAVKEMVILRGIFNPEEEKPVSIIHKK